MPTDSPQELLSTDTPGLPEVIIDGRKVAPGSDEVWKETMDLINMANLAKLRKNSDDQAAKGWVKNYNLNVTTQGEIVKLDQIGQALSLVNDGPAAMQLGINTSESLSTILVNQAANINFRNHRLEWFYVVSAAPAAVRVMVTG